MTSKVMVKIPVSPFAQVNKSKSGSVNGEIVTVRSQDVVPTWSSDAVGKSSENIRITQVEQNIKFLQDQHQLMLSGLHSEIEGLRNRNRELQFQLIFAKGTIPSSPSSPEDDSKHKVYVSPKQLNVTPLQVEILEKEMGELKIQLQEAESRNLYLSAIVDEQKKKLERYERDRERERERTVQADPELLRKLDDAEAIIRRLRRENSDLQQENAAPSAHFPSGDGSPISYHSNRENGSSYQSPNGSYQSNRGGRGNRRYLGSSNMSNQYRGNWFPPLQTQNYWQGGRGGKERINDSAGVDNCLPNLPQNGAHGGQYQGRRGTNNNHYHNGDGKKYRGGHNKSVKPS